MAPIASRVRSNWAVLATMLIILPGISSLVEANDEAQVTLRPGVDWLVLPPGFEPPAEPYPISPVAGAPDDSTPPTVVAPHQRAPLTDDVRGIATANNVFGVDLFEQLRTSRGGGANVLISPLSISTALTMTSAGAGGRNAEQMAAALRFDGPGNAHAGFGALLTDLNRPREGYELSVANRLFGQEDFPFHAAFLNRLAMDYQAPLERLDFYNAPDPSRKYINEWVADQTNQRIKDLLPGGSVTQGTRLVLTNAVYFNGKWKYEFDEEATQDMPFHLANGAAASAPTMFQRKVFNYGNFGDFQMLELPYAGDDLSMVVMLPNERNGLPELEASVTAELINGRLENLELREVDVFLPKFTFKDEAKLKNPLLELGMTDAFNGGDFSGISDVDLHIDEVYHKTFIDVNESGTEAAAATAVVMVMTTSLESYLPPPPVFRADHPFLFALRDTHSGALLFMGRMANPGAATEAANVPEPGTAALMLGAIFGFASRRRYGSISRSHRPVWLASQAAISSGVPATTI